MPSTNRGWTQVLRKCYFTLYLILSVIYICSKHIDLHFKCTEKICPVENFPAVIQPTILVLLYTYSVCKGTYKNTNLSISKIYVPIWICFDDLLFANVCDVYMQYDPYNVNKPTWWSKSGFVIGLWRDALLATSHQRKTR
jgi:hypothetical protein